MVKFLPLQNSMIKDDVATLCFSTLYASVSAFVPSLGARACY